MRVLRSFRFRGDADVPNCANQSGGVPPIPAASVSSPDPEGSPIWHGYRAQIPTGWLALLPVFVEAPRAPQEQDGPDAFAALDQAMLRFQVAILLCRPEVDGQAAIREYEAGHLLEAAEVRPDGQYLQDAPVRPAFGVLPLACPIAGTTGQAGQGDCVVLLPLIDASPVSNRAALAPIMMFVNGACVYRSDQGLLASFLNPSGAPTSRGSSPCPELPACGRATRKAQEPIPEAEARPSDAPRSAQSADRSWLPEVPEPPFVARPIGQATPRFRFLRPNSEEGPE